MKDKIKKLIASKIFEQAKINIIIQNYIAMDLLDNETLDELLENKKMLEKDIGKLTEILKSL